VGNIIRHELRANVKASLLWAFGLSAMTYLMMYLFPSIAQEHAKWDRLVAQLPQSVLAGFGMNQLRLSDIFGYYGTQVYPLLVLFVAIYAVMLFSALLAREESEGTIEFLMAKPVSRTAIFLGKALAALALAVLCNGLLFLATWGSFAEFQTKVFSLGLLGWFSLGLLLVTVVFGSFALLLSCYLPRPRTLLSLTIGVAFACYLVGIASAMSAKLRDLRYLSPFQFVDATTLVRRGDVPPWHVAGLCGLCGLFLVWAWAFYREKDIAP